jgi:hypothetical protein
MRGSRSNNHPNNPPQKIMLTVLGKIRIVKQDA